MRERNDRWAKLGCSRPAPGRSRAPTIAADTHAQGIRNGAIVVAEAEEHHPAVWIRAKVKVNLASTCHEAPNSRKEYHA